MSINKKIFIFNILFILCAGFLLCAYCVYKGDLVVKNLTSYFVGIFSYFVPQLAFFYIANRRNYLKKTANIILYDAVYGFVIKFMLVILILGCAFLFFELNDTVTIFTFVSMVIFNLVLYPTFIICHKEQS